MPNSNSVPAVPDKKGTIACIAISALVIGLYFVPYGYYILYPFSLIYTFVHEMGHGIAAIMVGGHFEKFIMNLDGSGLATNKIPVDLSRFGRAFIAFGGLVAPAIMAAISLILGRSPKASRIGFYIFAGICALSLIFVVRNLFGFIFVALCGCAALCIAKFPKSDSIPRYSMLILAITLLTAVFSRGDYLFVKYATGASVGSANQLSDVGQIAENLFLPYWFWGGLIGLISVVILIVGIMAFFRVKPGMSKKSLPSDI